MNEDLQNTVKTMDLKSGKENSSHQVESNATTENPGAFRRILKVVSESRFWKARKDPDKAHAAIAQQPSSEVDDQKIRIGGSVSISQEVPKEENSINEEPSREYKVTVTDREGNEIPRIDETVSLKEVGRLTSVLKRTLQIWESVKEHPDTAAVGAATLVGVLSMITGSDTAAELSTFLGGASLGYGLVENGLFGILDGEIDMKRKMLGALTAGAVLLGSTELFTLMTASGSDLMAKYFGIHTQMSESTTKTISVLSGFVDDAAMGANIGTKAAIHAVRNFARVS